MAPRTWQLSLGVSALKVAPITPVGDGSPTYLTRHPFITAACSYIAVGRPKDSRRYAGRAHSLWFCDAQEEGRFGWHEVAFMDRRPSGYYRDYFGGEYGRTSKMNGVYSPYALDAGDTDAHFALTNSPEGSQVVAWPFSLIRVDDLDEFIDRWANWFAACSQGRLEEPVWPLNITPHRSWRTGHMPAGQPPSADPPPLRWSEEAGERSPQPRPSQEPASRWRRMLSAFKPSDPTEQADDLPMYLRPLEDQPPVPPAGMEILPPSRPGFAPSFDRELTREEIYRQAHGRDARELDEKWQLLQQAWAEEARAAARVPSPTEAPGPVDAAGQVHDVEERPVTSDEYSIWDEAHAENVRRDEQAAKAAERAARDKRNAAKQVAQRVAEERRAARLAAKEVAAHGETPAEIAHEVPPARPPELPIDQYAALLAEIENDMEIGSDERLERLEILQGSRVSDRENPQWLALWERIADLIASIKPTSDEAPSIPESPLPMRTDPGRGTRARREARIAAARANAAEATPRGPLSPLHRSTGGQESPGH